MTGRRIHHIAIEDDWGMSQLLGQYEVSTRGRSFDDEGYIRACDAAGVQRVLDERYADLHLPVVVVVLDADALVASGVPVEASGDRGGARVLGAIESNDPAIVIDVLPAVRDGERWLAPAELHGPEA